MGQALLGALGGIHYLRTSRRKPQKILRKYPKNIKAYEENGAWYFSFRVVGPWHVSKCLTTGSRAEWWEGDWFGVLGVNAPIMAASVKPSGSHSAWKFDTQLSQAKHVWASSSTTGGSGRLGEGGCHTLRQGFLSRRQVWCVKFSPRQLRPLSSPLWEPLWSFLILEQGLNPHGRQPWQRHAGELRFQTPVVAITSFLYLASCFSTTACAFALLLCNPEWWLLWELLLSASMWRECWLSDPAFLFPLFRFWHFTWLVWQEKKVWCELFVHWIHWRRKDRV